MNEIITSTKTAVFELAIDPKEIKTAQQKGERIVYGRNGKPFVHHYTKSKVAKSQRVMSALILGAKNKAGWICARRDKPVIVSVEFVYPLGSLPKRLQGKHKITRPDIDNLLKGLFDACTDCRLWEDDAQVLIGRAVKRYQHEGEQPRVLMMLSVDID